MLVNETISKYNTLLETDSDYITWIKVNKQLANMDEDNFLGVIYIPPTQSKFFSDEEF